MILTDPEWQAVLLSLKVSSGGCAEFAIWDLFAGYWFAVGSPAKRCSTASFIFLPVLPPVVVGYLLLISMGRRGFIGEKLYDWFGITFAFSWRGAVLAAAVMSFPLMVRAIRLALEGVDMKLEQAARTLGAGRWRVFYHHASAYAAGHHCRDGAGVRPLAGRVWCDHHLCVEHSRRDADHPIGHVYPDSDAECRSAAVHHLYRISHGFAAGF